MSNPILSLPGRLASNQPPLARLQPLRDWSRSVGVGYTIPSGAIAVRQGDASGAVLLLESGEMLLQRVERSGAEAAFGICESGAFVGLASAIQRAPHAASAVARADSAVVAIPQDRLHEALASPQLAAAIVEQLAREQVALIERYGARTGLSVRDRIVALLRDTAPPQGVRPWPVHLSTTDLAALAGTDRSSVCRILRALRAEGVVRYARGRVALLTPL